MTQIGNWRNVILDETLFEENLHDDPNFDHKPQPRSDIRRKAVAQEVERQLEADPMTRACNRCLLAAAWLVATLRRLGGGTLVYTRMGDSALLTAQDIGNSSGKALHA
jgi:hypothetical protein